MKRQLGGLRKPLNTEDINTKQNINSGESKKLLHLMQIHDSAFPIGSYTHSFGMETYIQQDKIKTREELFNYCRVYLANNLAQGDGIIVKEAYDLARKKDFEGLIYLEQICHSSKIASESRQASIKIGKQFLQTVKRIHAYPMLDEWHKRLEDKEVKGHFAVSYGLYAACVEFDLESALLTFFYSSVSSLVHNAVRAIPLGQHDGAQVIFSLLSEMVKVLEDLKDKSLADLSNQSIGIEISSMEHQFLYTRLFIS